MGSCIFKRFFAGIMIIFAVLLVGCSSLINPEPLPSDLTVEELENRMNVAMDPFGHYRDASSYVQRVIVKISTWYMDTDLLMEVRFKKPQQFRFDYYMNNKPVTSMFFDGVSAFMVDYVNKKNHRLNQTQYDKIARLVAMGQPNNSYSSNFPKIDIYECVIDGELFYWLRCYFMEDGSGYPYDVFVGKEDFLTRRVQFYSKETGEYSAVINTYSTYDNVVIPDTFTSTQDGYSENCDVIRYRLNVPISAETFKLPDFPMVEDEE